MTDINIDEELDNDRIPNEILLRHVEKLRSPLLVRLAQEQRTYNIVVVVFTDNLTHGQKLKLLAKGYSPSLSLRERSNYGQTCDEFEYRVH